MAAGIIARNITSAGVGVTPTIQHIMTAEYAAEVVAANAGDDWTYTAVEKAPGRYVVEIRDEDGEYIGNA
jgi:hypothetical protein